MTSCILWSEKDEKATKNGNTKHITTHDTVQIIGKQHLGFKCKIEKHMQQSKMTRTKQKKKKWWTEANLHIGMKNIQMCLNKFKS